MTAVSPFARSSVFDEPRLGGREQTVSISIKSHSLRAIKTNRTPIVLADRGNVQCTRKLPRN